MMSYIGFILIGIFILLLFGYKVSRRYNTDQTPNRIRGFFQFYRRLILPITFTLFVYLVYSSLIILPQFFKIPFHDTSFYKLTTMILGGSLLIGVYSVATIAITIISQTCIQIIPRKFSAIIPLFVKGLRLVIIVLLFNCALKFFGIPATWLILVNKLIKVFLIGTIGWFCLQIIHTAEAVFIEYHRTQFSKNLNIRKTYTHISIIKRILITLLSILTIAAMLMVFDTIRAAGATLLASAGLLATIVGLSAKGPLEGIFKGLQLAITQPIALHDTVVIEGESGTVDEIHLHHVVVTLWDKRQIILPSSYFLDKPFQNWTHFSNELSGNVFFYVNYKMPIEPIREKFNEFLKASEFWDQKVADLYVHDLKDKMIELRLIMSANDSAKLSKLRYEIREKLLQYMQVHHLAGLPII